MKVEILNKNKEEIKFHLSDVTDSFANELRRIMSTEVLTMAIELVDFKKNDSALPDEVLANRLGQIPLTFDQKAYNVREECDNCKGKGCSRCQVELVLKKKGPAVVYAEDLKIKAKDVQPVFDKIRIVELFEGEELQFEGIAELGNGKKNAKWQAAVVGYKENNGGFTFNVETVCGLKPEEIVLNAIEILESKSKNLGKELKKVK